MFSNIAFQIRQIEPILDSFYGLLIFKVTNGMQYSKVFSKRFLEYIAYGLETNIHHAEQIHQLLVQFYLLIPHISRENQDMTQTQFHSLEIIYNS